MSSRLQREQHFVWQQVLLGESFCWGNILRQKYLTEEVWCWRLRSIFSKTPYGTPPTHRVRKPPSNKEKKKENPNIVENAQSKRHIPKSKRYLPKSKHYLPQSQR